MNPETNFFKRKAIDALIYRQGPSSISDEELLRGSKLTDDDAPLGLCEYNSKKGDDQAKNAGSEVLIVYFAKLGHSKAENICVDLEYIETLIKSGADVNFTDDFGQTVLHEVALRWPLEVAKFLFAHNANLNLADNFGRTPLHVAASINFPTMVKWLIENGADIHAVTLNENQTSLHYASKYNSVYSLTHLLELGAKLDARDFKERTPLQLAAETGREDTARILLQHGAPAGVYNDTGMSCLSHMIEKMPDVAAEALDQFQKIDKGNRTTFYYLSYLEIKKWKMNRKFTKKGRRMVSVREPLEAIVKYQDPTLIMHPVIQRLLTKKTGLYGQRNFIFNLLINFIFTALWTAVTVTLPHYTFDGSNDTNTTNTNETDILLRVDFYMPYNKQSWRIVLELIGLLLAVYFFIQTRIQFHIVKQNFESLRVSRLQEVKRDLVYCHPRWPQEKKVIEEEMININSETQRSLYDAWFIFDVLCFAGLTLLTITRIMLIFQKHLDDATYESTLKAHYYAFPVVLIITWLRFMSAFRPFITLGPFIAMLGHVAAETVKFGFLFLEFFIPYSCAIWIIFGGDRGDDNSYPFLNFDDVMFQLLRMTVTDDFSYEKLFKHQGLIDSKEKVVAQIICGTYFAFMSITCINLYIALLSETFTRVFTNATTTAYMLQAEALIIAEKKLSNKKQKIIQKTIAKDCSPEAVFNLETEQDAEGSSQVLVMAEKIGRQLEFIQKYQAELKSKTDYLTTEGSMLLSEQDEILEDMSSSLKFMTSTD